MFSCYKNTKEKLLVRVCKKYAQWKMSSRTGTMTEEGRFTLQAVWVNTEGSWTSIE